MIIFHFLESFPEWISSKVYYYKRISMTSDIFDPLESFSQWTSLIKLLKFYFPYRWYFSIFLKIFSKVNFIKNRYIYIRQFLFHIRDIFPSSQKSFPGRTFIENPSHIYIRQFKPVITNNPRDISRCSFRISFPLNSRVATWSKDRIFQFNVAANANAPILAWN